MRTRDTRATTLVRLIGMVILCTPIAITGCSKRVPPVARDIPPPPVAAETPPAPPAPPAPAPENPSPPALSEDEIFARKTLDELNAERPLGDVFFSYNESTIRDDARATLQRNADWMRRWPSTRITIEGHCDSRGTSEYNLALGERRASAVRAYLVSLGIGSDRIAVISKGEESPACFEENEACWQQNRRGTSIITAK